MPRLLSPRPLVAAAAALALALGACSQDEDVTQERFQSDLEERTGVDEEVAACLTDAVFADYDQAEINRIYRAATEDELGNERRDELAEINQRCITDVGGSDATDDGGEDPEG